MTARQALFSVTFLLVLLIDIAPSWCADRDLVFTLNERGSYDTNPLMLTSGAKSLYGSVTTPKLSFTSRTPTKSLQASTSIDQNIFNQSAYNTTDAHGALSLSKDLERWGTGFKGDVNYDTTRASEITTFGLDVGAVRRLSYSLTPNIAYKPTSRDKIDLSGSYIGSTYDSVSLTDYHVYSAELSYTRSLTPTDDIIFSTHARRYQADNTLQNRSDSIGPMIGYFTALSPNLKGQVFGGIEVSRSKVKGQPETGNTLNAIYKGGLTYSGEKYMVDVTGSHMRQPYANGQETILNSLSLSGKYLVNSLLSFNLNTKADFGDTSGSNASQMDSLYAVSPGITYQLTPTLGLNALYRYKHEKLTNRANNTAEAHIAHVGISWSPRMDFGL